MNASSGFSRFIKLGAVFALLVSTVVGISALPASAATFNVTRFDDPPPGPCFASDCSLREAILGANFDPGTLDTINLPAGTYTLTITGPGEDANITGDLDIAGDVEIVGAGQDTTVVELIGLGERGFHIHSGKVFISELQIQNGREPSSSGGGAILHQGTNLELNRITFRSNQFSHDLETILGDGGAVKATGDLVVIDSLFELNQGGSLTSGFGSFTLGGSGGAIWSGARLTIVGSKFESNRAGSGTSSAGHGGAVLSTGPSTVSSSVFTLNVAGEATGAIGTGNGGALAVASGTMVVSGSTFVSNQTGGTLFGTSSGSPGGDGGAIHSRGDTLEIIGSDFRLNTTSSGFALSGSGEMGGRGGAIMNDAGALTVTDSTFESNRTGAGAYSNFGGPGGNGGAIWVDTDASIIGSTFSANTTGIGGSSGGSVGGAGGDGGAIFSSIGELSILASTFAGNSAGNGGDGVAAGVNGGRGGNGAAIATSSGQLILNFTTISLNTAGNGGASGGSGGVPGVAGLGGGLWTAVDAEVGHTAIGLNNGVGTGFDCFTEGVAKLFVTYTFVSVDSGCAWAASGPGNQMGNLGGPLDPMLGPLGFNGGPTLTMQPLAGSTLIDNGSTIAPCSGNDQRFVSRPQGSACDIGAVEVGGLDLTVVSPGCVAYDSVSSGDGALAPGTPREVGVVASGCVPAGATAVVLGLTAKSPQAPGNLRISEAGVAPEGGVVNYVSNGLDNSNTVTVPLSFAGAVDVTANTGATDVRLVVVGYYSPSGTLKYFPLTPCAVADSRTIALASAPTGGFVGPFTSTSAYPDVDVVGTFNVVGDNQGGGNTDCLIPAGADAVLVNTVSIAPTGTGGVAIGEGGTTPTEPTTNFAPLPLNNAAVAIVPVDALGKIAGNTVGTGSTHVRLVVLGYFDSPTGQAYSPVNPCAAFDSRTGLTGDPNPPTGVFAGKRIEGAGGVTTYQATGAIPSAQGGETACGVPSGATAVLINLVAIQADSLGNFRAYATGTTPTGGVVNFANLVPAMNNSNAVVVPLSAAGEMDLFVNAPLNAGNPTVHARGVILGYFD